MLTNQEKFDYHLMRFREQAVSPMNPEAKKLLVEALRSGDYAQTNTYLQLTTPFGDVPAGFCCLGVLSEVAKNEGTCDVKSEVSQNGKAVMYYSSAYGDRSSAVLIKSVSDWANMPDGVESALMGINDNGGTFAQIADLIEEYL